MSLINQALKEEQRRRAPQMSAAASLRMRRFGQSRNSGDKALSVVVGFAIVGLILAGVAAAFIYFGSRFIDGLQFAEKQPSTESQAAAAAPAAGALPPEVPASANGSAEAPASLEGLSATDLDKLRQLLRGESGVATATEGAPAPAVSDPQLRASNQAIVDRFQIQGLRKAGQSSRAFLNGKLYKIGDIVDQASGLVLVGYTDSSLVFEDPAGHRYERSL